MDIQKLWEKALKKTEIIRPRVLSLSTVEQTQVPYIFLSKSAINKGDTVVRKGQVTVEKPMIISPLATPFFEGFDFEKDLNVSEDMLKTFFLVRGIQFPTLKYNNEHRMEVYEGNLGSAIEHFTNFLQRSEDTAAGLVAGPEDAWQLSILIFVCSQIARGAGNDVKKLFDDLHRKGLMS